MEKVKSSGASKLPGIPPLVINPSSAHTHSLILLHGLGSTGEKFGQELVTTICSNGKTLCDTLPNTKFIFPTSKRRRSTAFKRAVLTQWFDIASLDDPSARCYTQYQGLQESCKEIGAIIEQEAEKIPRQNIILGGISQGCATALICLLSLTAPLGGFAGMSGWLPFSHDIGDLLDGSNEVDNGIDDSDPFHDDRSSANTEAQDGASKVFDYVKDMLSEDGSEPTRAGSSISTSVLSTPIFLAHGEKDEKIRISIGRTAYRLMERIGFRVEWRSYEDLGHWYKTPDEIDDLVHFIQALKPTSKVGAEAGTVEG